MKIKKSKLILLILILVICACGSIYFFSIYRSAKFKRLQRLDSETTCPNFHLDGPLYVVWKENQSINEIDDKLISIGLSNAIDKERERYYFSFNKIIDETLESGLIKKLIANDSIDKCEMDKTMFRCDMSFDTRFTDIDEILSYYPELKSRHLYIPDLSNIIGVHVPKGEAQKWVNILNNQEEIIHAEIVGCLVPA